MHQQQLGVTPEKAKAKEINDRFEQECNLRISEF